jgi:hypothetical protein
LVAELIRYYLDQHIPGVVVNGRRRRGIEVPTAHEASRCGLPDPDQLAFAIEQERVIVSFHPDFLAQHNAETTRAGIAWCPATKYPVDPLIQMLILLCSVANRDAMKNQVEYL